MAAVRCQHVNHRLQEQHGERRTHELRNDVPRHPAAMSTSRNVPITSENSRRHSYRGSLKSVIRSTTDLGSP